MAFDKRWTERRLVERREEAARLLPLLAEFVPGTVNETWRKCGKPTCHCARDGDPGHGPRLLWSRTEDGKTRSSQVPERLAEAFRDGIDAFHLFGERVKEISQINAVLAERSLLRPGQAPRTDPAGQAGKKGALRAGPRTPSTS
jgi:hypothetical protein